MLVKVIKEVNESTLRRKLSVGQIVAVPYDECPDYAERYVFPEEEAEQERLAREKAESEEAARVAAEEAVKAEKKKAEKAAAKKAAQEAKAAKKAAAEDGNDGNTNGDND